MTSIGLDLTYVIRKPRLCEVSFTIDTFLHWVSVSYQMQWFRGAQDLHMNVKTQFIYV
jgi:hypothetical protein